jgi:hypothetical protein
VDSTVDTSGLIRDFDDGEGSRLMEVMLFWFINSLQARGISRAFGIIKPTRNRGGLPKER